MVSDRILCRTVPRRTFLLKNEGSLSKFGKPSVKEVFQTYGLFLLFKGKNQAKKARSLVIFNRGFSN